MNEKFKERLISLRKEKNLTQDKFAELMGVSKSTISMYENGRRTPDFELEEKIADFFNVDLDYLRGRTNIKNKYQFDNLNTKISSNIKEELKSQDDIITTYNLTPDELIEYEKIKSVNRALFFNDNRGSDEDKEELDEVLKKIFIKSLLNKRNKEK